MSQTPGTQVEVITDQNFEPQVLRSTTPFLLDLSAEWCGPCRAVAPVVAELASEYAGKVRFGSLDVDSNPNVATRYQVRSIPTLLMFQNGEVVGQLIGAHPKGRIVELLGKAA